MRSAELFGKKFECPGCHKMVGAFMGKDGPAIRKHYSANRGPHGCVGVYESPAPRPVGRPVSTGSAGVPPVFYRVSAEQHAELKAEGRASKPRLTANAVAKARAFPAHLEGGKPR